jgi:hypothetical protein
MNIIEYKVNEEKLWSLIKRAYEAKLIEPCFVMHPETLNCLESCSAKNVMLKAKDKDEIERCYKGIPIITSKTMGFGEVQIMGYKEKECSRITLYADGTQKIETNVTDRVLIGIA